VRQEHDRCRPSHALILVTAVATTGSQLDGWMMMVDVDC
jgi:hypothetical protein